MGEARTDLLLEKKVEILASTAAPISAPSGTPTQQQLDDFAAAVRSGSKSESLGVLQLIADGAVTLTTAQVYGYIGDASSGDWHLIGNLFAGADIAMTATIGFAEKLLDVGIFDFLAISDAGAGGANVVANYIPAEATV